MSLMTLRAWLDFRRTSSRTVFSNHRMVEDQSDILEAKHLIEERMVEEPFRQKQTLAPYTPLARKLAELLPADIIA